MGETSHPQPQPAGEHRTTQQETVEPSITAPTTTTAAAPPTSTHGTTASRPSRKDAPPSHKHNRSNNGHGHAASSTVFTTTNAQVTTGGHSNNNNKRHSHTVTTSKTRPMMRSVSNPSQHHQEQKQQHAPTAAHTVAHTAATTATTKSERRARTSTEQRKRRPKFVCGDHADEDLSSDQQHQEQLTHSRGAATGKVGEGEGEEGGTEEVRELEHDGHHPYHPPRHKHDPYPVSPSRHNISLHQDHHPQSTEAAGEGGGRRGMGSQAVSSQQGNLDLERGPNSESIPNNSQRLQSSTPPAPAPMRAIEKEQEGQQPEVATIRLTAPDSMITLPTSTRKENTTKKMDGPFASSTSSSAEESDVSVTRAKLTNLTLVGKDEQEQQQQRKQGDRIPKDTTLADKSKGEVSHDHNNNNNRETMIQPIVPELIVHSTSTTSTPNLAGGGGAATIGGHLQSSQQQRSHPAAGVAASTTSPSQRPSERLTRLLNPSLSTTSLPSLSKTTSQPVVAIVSPNHNHIDSIVDSSDSASSHRKDSSPSQQDAPPPMTAAASAVDLVSKLLNPVATLGRSRSQSSLHSMFTNALSGSPSSSSATTGQDRRHHARHGSAASLAESVKSNPGSSSTGMGMGMGMGMGFMTSPQRVSDPNVYLISRFITPASQQQAMLSSSAPKHQQAGSLSGSSSTGSLAARRRLPASLRMTSSDMDVPATAAGGGPSTTAAATAATASGTTSTSPGAASTYSSAEGPTPTHSHSATPLPPHPSFPSSNPSGSPWNPVEPVSRTQQKLNLQRDSSYDDLDEQEMTRRGRVHKEMERIQREYKCIRVTSDPVLESMSRCFALQRQQQLEQQQSEALGGGRGHGDEARSF
ncbi:MAG: hypothetical protein JOS17DRAFT_756118 [Linnemannia elongata]|nr:MAG: hypothetical protein JOS17DRAFT_756118 [Linnemannia elongata]